MNLSAQLRRRNELLVAFALVSAVALSFASSPTDAVSGALASTGTLALVLALRDTWREQRARRAAARRATARGA